MVRGTDRFKTARFKLAVSAALLGANAADLGISSDAKVLGAAADDELEGVDEATVDEEVVVESWIEIEVLLLELVSGRAETSLETRRTAAIRGNTRLDQSSAHEHTPSMRSLSKDHLIYSSPSLFQLVSKQNPCRSVADRTCETYDQLMTTTAPLPSSDQPAFVPGS